MAKKIKILFVVDFQVDFISNSLGTPEAQAIVPNVIEKIRNHEDWIITTKDTHYDDSYFNTQEGKNLPIKHCIVGTDGWRQHPDITEELIKKNHFYNISKTTFGNLTKISFSVEDIYGHMCDFTPTEYDIESIEIIGLCTDICVISNALILKAMYPEVKIIVDASCCAGTTPEKHKAALEVMKSCQIEVINED